MVEELRAGNMTGNVGGLLVITVVVQMGNSRLVRTVMLAFIQSVRVVTQVDTVTIKVKEIMAVAGAGVLGSR